MKINATIDITGITPKQLDLLSLGLGCISDGDLTIAEMCEKNSILEMFSKFSPKAVEIINNSVTAYEDELKDDIDGSD